MQGTLVKFKNYGTNDPFIARMFFGILKLRDFIIKDEKSRLEFDNIYTPIEENLEEARESMFECLNLINSHTQKVKNMEIISFQGSSNEIINVSESVDREVSKKIKDFFIKGEIGIRGIILLYKHLGYSISFMKKNNKEFEERCKRFMILNKGDKFEHFIHVVREGRQWYSQFNEARRRIEHEGFTLPHAKYIRIAENMVEVAFPLLNGLQITEFMTRMWDSLFLFAEDLVVSAISLKLENPLVIVYIPEEQRDKSMPLRYDIGIEDLQSYLKKEIKEVENESLSSKETI